MLTDSPDIQAMHAEHNRIRAQHSLPAQALDESLCQISTNWAKHMAGTGDVWHGGGEHVIASNSYASLLACFDQWMDSNKHRNWLLSRAPTKCGWGAVRSGAGWYWAGTWNAMNPDDYGGRTIANPPASTPTTTKIAVPTTKPTSRFRRPLLDWLFSLWKR